MIHQSARDKVHNDARSKDVDAFMAEMRQVKAQMRSLESTVRELEVTNLELLSRPLTHRYPTPLDAFKATAISLFGRDAATPLIEYACNSHFLYLLFHFIFLFLIFNVNNVCTFCLSVRKLSISGEFIPSPIDIPSKVARQRQPPPQIGELELGPRLPGLYASSLSYVQSHSINDYCFADIMHLPFKTLHLVRINQIEGTSLLPYLHEG
ncbi:MAG: hypothetical protein GY820_30700 [Gammaproteobacteria bacterium]|nr:hypothetical protein [Gammaproteobacteria bacterium]